MAGTNAPEEPTLVDEEVDEDPAWLLADCALLPPALLPPDDEETPPVEDEGPDDEDDDDDEEELLSPGRGHAARNNAIPKTPS